MDQEKRCTVEGRILHFSIFPISFTNISRTVGDSRYPPWNSEQEQFISEFLRPFPDLVSTLTSPKPDCLSGRLLVKDVFSKFWTRDYRVDSKLHNHYLHNSVNGQKPFSLILNIIRISLQWYADISWYHDTMYRFIGYLKNYKNHQH